MEKGEGGMAMVSGRGWPAMAGLLAAIVGDWSDRVMGVYVWLDEVAGAQVQG